MHFLLMYMYVCMSGISITYEKKFPCRLCTSSESGYHRMRVWTGEFDLSKLRVDGEMKKL